MLKLITWSGHSSYCYWTGSRLFSCSVIWTAYGYGWDHNNPW